LSRDAYLCHLKRRDASLPIGKWRTEVLSFPDEVAPEPEDVFTAFVMSRRLELSARIENEGWEHLMRISGTDASKPSYSAPADSAKTTVGAELAAPTGDAARTQAELAANRQAVVMPILNQKGWSRGKWATQAGVGKNCVYDYLAGKRRLSDPNRSAMADELGLAPQDLPK
jgi:hypothetical protein